MTHDKFCPSTQDDLPLWQPPCTVCEMLVKVRADEREQAAQRVEAIMRYWTEGKEFLFADWEIRNITNAARGGEQA